MERFWGHLAAFWSHLEIKNVWFSLRFPILFVNSCFRPEIVSEGILEPYLRQLGSSKVVKSGPRAAKRPSRGAQERPRAAQERPKSGQERPKSGPRAAQEQPRAAQERPRATQERPREAQGRARTAKMGSRAAKTGPRRPRTPQRAPQDPPDPPRTPPNAPQEAPRSLQECEVRPKSFEIVERCRKKSRKQTLEPQVRNPRTKQAARRSTRRKIRRPRVRSSPYDPHEESSASQRKPQEFPNNFRYHRVPHLYNCLAQPEHRTSLRGGGGVARSAF